jgi:hypothetical protein
MKHIAYYCLVFAAIASAIRELRHGNGVIELCLVALVAAAASWFIERRP